MKKYDAFYTGIDLGTTNSAISVLEQDGSKLRTTVIPVDRKLDFKAGRCSHEKRGTIPTSVAYLQNKGEFEIEVGDCAVELAKTRPYAVSMSVKEQMGQPRLNYPNWQEDCPDQTPHQVASRVLKHLVWGVEDAYGDRPTDAVITVPANYSAMKREATLKAAELAGLNVRNDDGTYRDDILLSEPEAVIYHILNEMQNGDLSLRCDFHQPKKVLVYDMGGGTLDITFHEICRNPEDPEIYEMKLIATNRFSDMAGNTVDRMLAQYMYRNYMDELRDYDEILYRQVQRSQEEDMLYFERMAELVKVDLNNKVSNYRRRGSEVSEGLSVSYGGLLSGGRSVEADMTRKELEDCLRPCLGQHYVYQDYKRFDRLPEEKNLLYPVLQVLNRAAEKLKEPDLNVDMVILNGGMSRMYLVRDTLTRFFGFPMTMVSDPDTSVAQGASVYHYYRSRKGVSVQTSRFDEMSVEQKASGFAFKDVTSDRQIKSTGTVLNESLYLGVRCGAAVLLAEAGVDLPYQSETPVEYILSAGESGMELPLRERYGQKEVTVGRGRICFGKTSHKPQTVNVSVSISRSGLLSLDAWCPLGTGSVEILLGEGCVGKSKRMGKTLNPPTGTKLHPANQMSQLKSLVKRVDELSRKNQVKQKGSVIAQLNQCTDNMKKCGNPQDFAQPILKELCTNGSDAMRLNLFSVAQQLCPYWTQEQRAQLSKYAIQGMSALLNGLSEMNTFRREANSAAILVVGACGIPEDMKKLDVLKDNACYAHLVEQVQQSGRIA